MKCVITDDAKADLRDIPRFLQRANPGYGKRVSRRFKERFRFIARHPFQTLIGMI